MTDHLSTISIFIAVIALPAFAVGYDLALGRFDFAGFFGISFLYGMIIFSYVAEKKRKETNR